MTEETKTGSGFREVLKAIVGVIAVMCLMSCIYTPVFAATNNADGRIRIRKVDNDGSTPLSGASYNVYADSNGNGTFDVGYDRLAGKTAETSAGVYELSGLPNGNYFVVETQAPAGRQASGEIYRVTLNNSTPTATATNSMGSLSGTSLGRLLAANSNFIGSLLGKSGVPATQQNAAVAQAAQAVQNGSTQNPAALLTTAAGTKITVPDADAAKLKQALQSIADLADQNGAVSRAQIASLIAEATAEPEQTDTASTAGNTADTATAGEDASGNPSEDTLTADSGEDDGTVSADSTADTGVSLAGSIVLMVLAVLGAAGYFFYSRKKFAIN